MIRAQCPGCGTALNAPDKVAGKNAKCPRCGGIVPIPMPTDADAAWKIGSVPPQGAPPSPTPRPAARPARTPAPAGRAAPAAAPTTRARRRSAAALGEEDEALPARTRAGLRREEAARSQRLGAAGAVAVLGAAVVLAGFCLPWQTEGATSLGRATRRLGFRFPEIVGELAEPGKPKPYIYILYFLYLLPVLALFAGGVHLAKMRSRRSLAAGAGYGCLFALAVSLAALHKGLIEPVNFSGVVGSLAIGFHASALGGAVLAASGFLPGSETAVRAPRERLARRRRGEAAEEPQESTTAMRRRRRRR